MNETLKEHIELKANGTMAGKRFLHLDETNPNYNYAANTYLIALEELAALREAGEKMAEMLKFLQLQNDAARLESAGLWSVNGETEMQVAEAREAWEAANK